MELDIEMIIRKNKREKISDTETPSYFSTYPQIHTNPIPMFPTPFFSSFPYPIGIPCMLVPMYENIYYKNPSNDGYIWESKLAFDKSHEKLHFDYEPNEKLIKENKINEELIDHEIKEDKIDEEAIDEIDSESNVDI